MKITIEPLEFPLCVKERLMKIPKISKLHIEFVNGKIIRQEIKKLDSFSEQTRFMVENKIETIEDLNNFDKNNYEEYQNLMGKRENLWKRYHRAKTEDKKSDILTEINDIQPKIKELRKLDNYCKEIKKTIRVYPI